MLIIADDITGAAEIAGIAWRKGLKVRLMVYQPNMPTTPLSSWRGAGGEALILATDTRSGTEEEAVKTIEELATCLYSGVQECRSVGVQTLPSSTSNSSTRQLVNLSTDASNLSTCQLVNSSTDIIFKKTDSVLRGHVAAELQALMRVTGKQKALLIPQNPSKGRIVKDGIYYINGTPLDQTSFAYDPEFPAKTAEAKKLLKRSAGVQECRSSDNSWTSNLSSPSSHLSSISSPKGEDGRGLLLPDATTLEEIREHVAKADNDTLFAGGADMFEAVVDYLLGVQECRSEGVQTLPVQGVQECRSVGVQTLPSSTSNSSTCQLVNLSTDTLNSSTRQLVNSSTCKALNLSTEKNLILCGSTQSCSLIGEPFFANKNAIEVTMPEDVFHGTASIHETNAWIATLKDHWQSHDAMIVRIGHETTGGKEYAVRLRNLFGEMAYQILSPVQGVQEFRSSDNSILRSEGVKECRSVDITLASNPSSPTPPPSEGSGEVHPSSLIPHLSSQFRSEGVQTLPSSTNNLSTRQLVNSSTCEALNLSTCEALNSSTRIIIEGGATAYTVLERLGISSFDVEYEYSPGVVCLSHGNMRIILKPGSYPWGNLFEEL
ncbi:MAG: hypothetical protein IKK92_04220 [Prevotella sp.]|nr:hypothetical protein [Prevotella sp.]